VKIKSFHITRYGPLVYQKQVTLGKFNLFYGSNEDGKTLTIDALIKLLLGRKVRDFRAIDRVEEQPEGFLVLEDGEGNEIKLPRAGDLTGLLGITSSECRNIFIIRNSDLSILREGDFFTALTDRLTGLRMEEISRVKAALVDIGKLTQGGIFRDIKGEKLKTRIEKAQSLVSQVEPLLEEMKNEGHDALMYELVQSIEKIEALEGRMSSLESARRREQFEKGSQAIEALDRALVGHRAHGSFNEEEYDTWLESDRNTGRLTEALQDLEHELSLKREELKELQGQLRKAERSFSLLEEKKKRVDEELKPLLREHERRKGIFEGEKRKAGFYTMLLLLCGSLTGLSIFGAIFRTNPFFIVSATVFVAGAAVFSILKFRYLRQGSWLAKTQNQLLSDASRFGLEAENLKKTVLSIQELEESNRRQEQELTQLRVEEGVVEGRISNLSEQKIPECKGKLAQELGRVEELKKRTGTGSVSLYGEKLAKKRELSEEVLRQEGILKSLFGDRPEAGQNGGVSFWKSAVSELEPYRDDAGDIVFSEKTLERAKNELDAQKQKVSDIQEKADRIRGKLMEVEREANQVLDLVGDYLHCDTSVDLIGIRDRLEEFMDRHEEEKEDSLELLNIFSLIESGRREKVSRLFGEESAVTRYFSYITDGRYTGVKFRSEDGTVEVVRADGRTMEAHRLSAGAYDQLYLSIRLALGEQLLKEGKGFFIMDDPFLRADSERLARQMETLRKITGFGWQILYFSAKEEVNRLLGGKKDVVTVQLPGTFAE